MDYMTDNCRVCVLEVPDMRSEPNKTKYILIVGSRYSSEETYRTGACSEHLDSMLTVYRHIRKSVEIEIVNQ
jgi:hypothetical protein